MYITICHDEATWRRVSGRECVEEIMSSDEGGIYIGVASHKCDLMELQFLQPRHSYGVPSLIRIGVMTWDIRTLHDLLNNKICNREHGIQLWHYTAAQFERSLPLLANGPKSTMILRGMFWPHSWQDVELKEPRLRSGPLNENFTSSRSSKSVTGERIMGVNSV